MFQTVLFNKTDKKQNIWSSKSVQKIFKNFLDIFILCVGFYIEILLFFAYLNHFCTSADLVQK